MISIVEIKQFLLLGTIFGTIKEWENMSKWDTVLKKARRGSELRFSEFRGLAEHLGCTVETPSKGSHFMIKHPELKRPIPIQSRKGKAKYVQVDQFISEMEALGLIESE